MKYVWILLLFFTFSALAADIDGTWTGSMEIPNGAIENEFVFKLDGKTLKGTAKSGQYDAVEITDGKLEGENLSFTVVRKFADNDFKFLYKGTLKDGQIKLTMTVPDRDWTGEMILKKTS